jgi:hypothetical protein
VLIVVQVRKRRRRAILHRATTGIHWRTHAPTGYNAGHPARGDVRAAPRGQSRRHRSGRRPMLTEGTSPVYVRRRVRLR